MGLLNNLVDNRLKQLQQEIDGRNRLHEPSISATPRNQLLGVFADALGSINNYAQRPDPSMPMGKANPVLGLLADTFGLPGTANTVNELSYGNYGALGTGKGMTWKPKPDTIDAATTLLPLGMTVGKAAVDGGVKLAQKATPAIESVVNRTMAQGGKPAQLLGDLAYGTQSNLFAGVNAKTADKAKLSQAEQMLSKGVDPAQVWKETGWGRGPDGKWRFEIDDTRAGMRLNGPKFGTEEMSKLGEVYDHNLFYDAYPEAKKINLTWNDSKGGGSFSAPRTWAQYIDIPQGINPAKQRSITTHEAQHAIQFDEGFARGGSNVPTRQMEESLSRDLQDLLVSSPKEESLYNSWRSMVADMDAGRNFDPAKIEQVESALESTPSGKAILDRHFSLEGIADPNSAQSVANNYYLRQGGEAEARLAQYRLNLTPEERAAQFPFEPAYFEGATGVPIDSLIHRFDGGAAQMAIDPKGQKRLVEGLLGNGDGQRYRLGDIKPAQATQVDNFSGTPSRGLFDVFVAPEGEGHILKRRVQKQGIKPEKVGMFAKQAMQPDSVVLDAKTGNDFPMLVSQQLQDGGKLYRAEMPLRQVDDGFEVVSVIPKGLNGKK